MQNGDRSGLALRCRSRGEGFSMGDVTDKDLRQNIICTYNVLEAMRRCGVKNVTGLLLTSGRVRHNARCSLFPESAPFHCRFRALSLMLTKQWLRGAHFSVPESVRMAVLDFSLRQHRRPEGTQKGPHGYRRFHRAASRESAPVDYFEGTASRRNRTCSAKMVSVRCCSSYVMPATG